MLLPSVFSPSEPLIRDRGFDGRLFHLEVFFSGRRIDESDAPKGTHTGPKGDTEGYWMKQHLILPHKVSPL